MQPGACTHCAGRSSTCKAGGAYATNVPLAHWLNAAALTGLRSIFSDVHAAGKNGFDFFLSAGLTELCEAISVRTNGKDGGSSESPSLVCGDRLTNVLVSGMMGVRNGGIAVVPYLMQVLLHFAKGTRKYPNRGLYFTYVGIITQIQSLKTLISLVAPYLPRYHPNKKAKLNTSFAFCFLCFCYQNFFFLHSHKLRMTKSTLTPMTAG